MTPTTLDPAATKLERELKHTSPLVGCRFDPAGRFLFAATQDNTIQRFDLLTGAKTALVGHASWVRGLAFVAGTPLGSEEAAAAGPPPSALHAAVGFAATTRPVP